MRVVLVDDSFEVQRSLRALLDLEAGVDVVGTAQDAAGAARVVDACEPDLVVLDVALRGQDRGYDVLRDLLQRHPRLTVVVLSNYGWSSMRNAFLDAGAAAYFDKALEYRQAIEWIRKRARAGDSG